MDIQSHSQIDQINKNSSNGKNKKTIYFVLTFTAISMIFAFIVGGYFLGKEEAKKQNAATKISEQVKISSAQIPDNPDNWTPYQIKAVNIELKLPEKITKLGNWQEYESTGGKGSLLCFSYEKSGSTCNGSVLVIGGSSMNFSEEKEGNFTDLQGFSVNANGAYFIKSTSGQEVELKDVKFKKFESENGVEIIKILGQKSNTGQSNAGNPGEGYLGALVNTKNPKYPGLAIKLKLDSDISEYEFDQILRSIKLTN